MSWKIRLDGAIDEHNKAYSHCPFKVGDYVKAKRDMPYFYAGTQFKVVEVLQYPKKVSDPADGRIRYITFIIATMLDDKLFHFALDHNDFEGVE